MLVKLLYGVVSLGLNVLNVIIEKSRPNVFIKLLISKSAQS
jgi:hypothetical protein